MGFAAGTDLFVAGDAAKQSRQRLRIDYQISVLGLAQLTTVNDFFSLFSGTVQLQDGPSLLLNHAAHHVARLVSVGVRANFMIRAQAFGPTSNL